MRTAPCARLGSAGPGRAGPGRAARCRKARTEAGLQENAIDRLICASSAVPLCQLPAPWIEHLVPEHLKQTSYCDCIERTSRSALFGPAAKEALLAETEPYVRTNPSSRRD